MTTRFGSGTSRCVSQVAPGKTHDPDTCPVRRSSRRIRCNPTALRKHRLWKLDRVSCSPPSVSSRVHSTAQQCTLTPVRMSQRIRQALPNLSPCRIRHPHRSAVCAPAREGRQVWPAETRAGRARAAQGQAEAGGGQVGSVQGVRVVCRSCHDPCLAIGLPCSVCAIAPDCALLKPPPAADRTTSALRGSNCKLNGDTGVHATEAAFPMTALKIQSTDSVLRQMVSAPRPSSIHDFHVGLSLNLTGTGRPEARRPRFPS